MSNKKQIYLDKMNFYNSTQDIYKINKYNYKYQHLMQSGGELSNDQKDKITKIINEKYKSVSIKFGSEKKTSNLLNYYDVTIFFPKNRGGGDTKFKYFTLSGNLEEVKN